MPTTRCNLAREWKHSCLLPCALAWALVSTGWGQEVPGRPQVIGGHAVLVNHQSSPAAVWAWGSNNRGQLGDGTINYSNVPVKVRGLPPDIVAIAAGGSHILALQSTGAVWAWGNNDSGQLGIGSHVDGSTAPVRVLGLHNIIATSLGYNASFAVQQQ